MVLTVEGDELHIRKADRWSELRGMLAASDFRATEALLEERREDRDLERPRQK